MNRKGITRLWLVLVLLVAVSAATAQGLITRAPPVTSPPALTATPDDIWIPPLETSWQWQLTGIIDQSYEVDMYDIDLFDNDASVVASLHAKGRKVICYLSAGSWEEWRPDK